MFVLGWPCRSWRSARWGTSVLLWRQANVRWGRPS